MLHEPLPLTRVHQKLYKRFLALSVSEKGVTLKNFCGLLLRRKILHNYFKIKIADKINGTVWFHWSREKVCNC